MNRNQLQNDFQFTDLILLLSLGISVMSLVVNHRNNEQLDKINQNLTEINKNEVLENINRLASGGK